MKAFRTWMLILLIQGFFAFGAGADLSCLWSDYLEEIQVKAEQGDPEAQLNLADLYAYGRGVPKDPAKAAQWYRRAARQTLNAAQKGDAKAQALLGRMFENGWGVPKDYTEAARWYRGAAHQGNADGQFGLGRLYNEGWGVEKDYIEAYRWFDLAAAQGIVEAAKFRESVTRFLSPEQIEDAQHRATSFLKSLGRK